MCQPQKRGYTLERKYYLPERVFFLNLIQCCSSDPMSVMDRITTKMQYEINIRIKYILATIQQIEGKYPEETAPEIKHILPNDFLKFVDKKCKNLDKKKNHYLLLQCYLRILDADLWVRRVSEDIEDSKAKPQCLSDDKQLLNEFSKCIEDLSAISLREYYRILNTIGKPLSKKSNQIRTFSRNENKVIQFTVENVLPDLIIYSESLSLSFFISNRWYDVVCKTRLKNGMLYGVIIIDSQKGDCFRKEIQTWFNSLKEIAKDPEPEEKTQKFGEILLSIYNYISVNHQNGVIYGMDADYIPQHSDLANQQASVPEDNKTFEWDGYIASHIFNYLKTFESTYENSPEFMASIDKVIEKIRPQIQEQIESTISFVEFRRCKKEGQSANTMFLWPSCTHLLPLLNKALHDASVINISV